MKKKRSLYPIAIHLIFRKADRILLLRRFNTGYEDGNYSLVAGHVEMGESVIEAGIREAKEEVGVSLQYHDINIIGIMHRKSNDERVDFFACVDHWNGDILNLEPEKCDELGWYTCQNVPVNTIAYIKRALSFSLTSIWYDEYGWDKNDAK